MGTSRRKGGPKSQDQDTIRQGIKERGKPFPTVAIVLSVLLAFIFLSVITSFGGAGSDDKALSAETAAHLRAIFDPPRKDGSYPVDEETLGLISELSGVQKDLASKILLQIQQNPLQIGERLRLCDALEKYGQSSHSQIDRFAQLTSCYSRLMEAFDFALLLPAKDSRRQILSSMQPTVSRAAGDRMVIFSEGDEDRLSKAVSYLRAGVLSSSDCGDASECRQACANLLMALHLNNASQEVLESTFQEVKRLPSLQVDWQSPQAIHLQLSGIRHQAFWENDAMPWLGEVAEQWQVIRGELDRYIEKQEAMAKKIAWDHQPESGYLAGHGKWNSVELAMNGKWREQTCQTDFPKTCQMIRDRPELNPDNFRWPAKATSGQQRPPVLMANIYQAVPHARIRAHFGTHGRLVASLGLRVPAGAVLRVGGESRNWEEGRFLLFDDSYMHEVDNDASEHRYVLALALLHPDCCSACGTR